MPQFGAIGVGLPNKTGVTTPSTAVGTSQILPSPSVWGSCDGSSLRDNPDGFFFDFNFKDVVTPPGIPNQNGTWTVPATGTDSAANLAFSSSAVAAAFIRPMLPVAPNGGNKLWAEVGVNFKQSTAQSFFFGFATSTGLSSTLIASSTTLLSTCGLIGFYMHEDVLGNIDAVYRNAASGSLITVLASTLTAGANNPDPGNPLFVPATAPGALSGNQGFVKLGITVTRTAAKFFVNGSLVATQTLDSTFDTTDSYGVVLAATTLSTNNTDNVQVAFLRAAARIG